MRIHLLALAFFSLLLTTGHAAPDTIKVTDHAIVGMKSKPGLSAPDMMVIKLQVEFTLTSKPEALLVLAIDNEAEMKFSTVDQKPVAGGKRKQKVEVVARLENFARDTLRGIVLLQEPNARAGSDPIAMSGLSLDVKKFRKG